MVAVVMVFIISQSNNHFAPMTPELLAIINAITGSTEPHQPCDLSKVNLDDIAD